MSGARQAVPEPACPEDGTLVEPVIHKRVRCYRCPKCRMVYDCVSGRVDAPKGRISIRYLRKPGPPLAALAERHGGDLMTTLATGWRYDPASGLLLPACDIHRRHRSDYELAA